jgi:TATA-binding protein-associated factor Taf7
LPERFEWRSASTITTLDLPFATDGPLDALYALVRRIRKANTEAELDTIEDEIDEILKAQRAKAAAGDEAAVDAATLNVTAHRLENLIHDRRQILTNGHVVASSG